MENYKPNTLFAIEKKNLFSYVVSTVWLKKKKDHTVYDYCERLDGNAVNWSLTQNRDG